MDNALLSQYEEPAIIIRFGEYRSAALRGFDLGALGAITTFSSSTGGGGGIGTGVGGIGVRVGSLISVGMDAWGTATLGALIGRGEGVERSDEDVAEVVLAVDWYLV